MKANLFSISNNEKYMGLSLMNLTPFCSFFLAQSIVSIAILALVGEIILGHVSELMPQNQTIIKRS